MSRIRLLYPYHLLNTSSGVVGRNIQLLPVVAPLSPLEQPSKGSAACGVVKQGVMEEVVAAQKEVRVTKEVGPEALQEPSLPDGVADRYPGSKSGYHDSTGHTSGCARFVDILLNRTSSAGHRDGDAA